MIDYIEPIFEGLKSLFYDPKIIIMWIVSAILFYFGIVKKKEPLLLIPISSGILFANLPMGELIRIGGNGEPDGFIKIFQDIGLTNKIFVEIGSGDGLENNTHFLILNDWKGIWIDSNKKYKV